jgi:predicted secreted protein
VEYKKKVRSLEGHTGRIGVISWARNVISTGIMVITLRFKRLQHIKQRSKDI